MNWAVSGSGSNPVDVADFGGTFPSGSVTFLPNEVSKTINVTVTGDLTIEQDENFTVTLSGATGGATLSTASAVGTIINDDAATTYQIVATDLVKLEGTGSGTTFSFTVNRSGVTSGTGSVDYALTGTPNTTDFSGNLLPSGTINFAANEASQVVTFTVSGDTAVESDEAFTITLSNASAGTAISVPTANGIIQNDDASISIQTTVVRTPEGNSGTTAFQYTVTRTGYLLNAVSATWTVSGGTTDPADANDFVGAALPTGTVSFPGDGTTTTQTIVVNVQGDTTVEPDENFIVTLSAPTVGLIIGTAARAGVIENDEIQPMSAGDVVITGVNATNDGFTFVPLINLLPGTVLKFTDNAWSIPVSPSSPSFATNEGYATFTVGASGVAAGTKIFVDIPTAATATVSPSAAGTVAVETGFNLAAGGDNVFVFQGPQSSPAFLFAVNLGAAYLTTPGSATTTTSTFLPSALTIGTSAVDALGAPTTAIAAYNDTLLTGTKAQLRDAVATEANWTVPATPPLSTADFTVTVPAGAVLARQIYYRNALSTIFNDGSPNPEAAIDTSKSALLPGNPSSFSNVSNYRFGLNGLLVDIQGFDNRHRHRLRFCDE